MADQDITGVDIVSDLNQGEDTVTGQPQEPNQQPDDIRSLLEEAAGLKVDEDGRVRDETGKFAKKPVEGEQQQVADHAGKEAEGVDPAQQQQVQAPAYGPELDKVVQALPPEHRTAVEAALVAREGAWTEFARQVEGHVNGYERLRGLEPVIAPRVQAWAVQGVSPAQAVNQLFALSDFATRDPKGFVHWFAGNNNIDLSEVGEDFVPVDPTIAVLEARVGQLTNVLNGMQNGQAQGVHQQYVSAVQQFETAQDDKGQPLRPHFSEVADHMLALVPMLRQTMSGQAPDAILQAAYDQAVYANPTTRSKVQAALEAKSVAERTAEAARKRTVGQSMSGSGPSSSSVSHQPVSGETVRGAIEAAFAQHS